MTRRVVSSSRSLPVSSSTAQARAWSAAQNPAEASGSAVPERHGTARGPARGQEGEPKARVAVPGVRPRRMTVFRRHPLVTFVAAILFLVATLLVSLFLNVEMAQDSYTISRLENRNAMLTQDVQARQNTLNGLKAHLPQEAEKLGMTLKIGNTTVDVSAPVDEDQVRRKANEKPVQSKADSQKQDDQGQQGNPQSDNQDNGQQQSNGQ